MSKSILLQTALALPNPDIEALIEGRMIVAMPRMFLNPGRTFALYPADNSNMPLMKPKQMSLFPESGQLELPLVILDKVLIKAWARCESCKMVNEPESLEALSRLTVWKIEALQQILQQRPFIFVAYLRVYLLPQPLELSVQSSSNFVSLPTSLNVTDTTPVLSDFLFAKRRKQLEKLEPPEHPELEELQSALVQLSTTNPKAKQLDAEIKMFLGWSSDKPVKPIKPDLAWINTIAALGDRSIELEEKKSNYQAGTDFENVVRDSLEFLGFTIDYAHKGGAGGLDLFCSKPYPLVGECKAGRLIPSGTAEELIKLGGMHLGADKFLGYTKLVIGPGNPSVDMLKAAKEWKISIINAMTLQKLVEFKAKYPGAVNLVELKPYLETGGQIDDRINDYIDKIEREIKVRSHIVTIVKSFLQDEGLQQAGVDALHGRYSGSNPPERLSPEKMHEILIELSSPLTGYLGRIKGEHWRRDRFYFLRDLQLDD